MESEADIGQFALTPGQIIASNRNMRRVKRRPRGRPPIGRAFEIRRAENQIDDLAWICEELEIASKAEAARYLMDLDIQSIKRKGFKAINGGANGSAHPACEANGSLIAILQPHRLSNLQRLRFQSPSTRYFPPVKIRPPSIAGRDGLLAC